MNEYPCSQLFCRDVEPGPSKIVLVIVMCVDSVGKCVMGVHVRG